MFPMHVAKEAKSRLTISLVLPPLILDCQPYCLPACVSRCKPPFISSPTIVRVLTSVLKNLTGLPTEHTHYFSLFLGICSAFARYSSLATAAEQLLLRFCCSNRSHILTILVKSKHDKLDELSPLPTSVAVDF